MKNNKQERKYRNQSYFSFTPSILNIYDMQNAQNWTKTKLHTGQVQEQNFTSKLLTSRHPSYMLVWLTHQSDI